MLRWQARAGCVSVSARDRVDGLKSILTPAAGDSVLPGMWKMGMSTVKGFADTNKAMCHREPTSP